MSDLMNECEGVFRYMSFTKKLWRLILSSDGMLNYINVSDACYVIMVCEYLQRAKSAQVVNESQRDAQ